MNKKLTTVAVSAITAWAVGFSAMASAEATVYGRVVAGAVYSDKDKGEDSGSWNFGAVGQDGGNGFASSRFGFKGETDLGNGMAAGFKIEREIDGYDAAADDEHPTNQRHNLVYLSGGFGTVTLGHQSNPYMNARHWDQTYFYGGNWGYGSGYRHEGIGYSLNTGGFSLNVVATANDTAEITSPVVGDDGRDATAADVALGRTVCENAGQTELVDCTAAGAVTRIVVEDDDALTAANSPGGTLAKSNDGVDGWILHAGYDFGPVALNVAHQTNETEIGGRDNTAIGVNGAAGPMDWYLAYQTSENTENGDDDVDSIGGFLGFRMSERDTLYGYYVSHDHDANDVTRTETILGYSRQIGPGLAFIAEYSTPDDDLDQEESEASNLAFALKMDF